MNSKGMFGKGNNDEKYTPAYAVRPLLEFISKEAIIWCPFDTKESEFVKVLNEYHKVVYSHVFNGQDFFKYDPTDNGINWDIIASNPPFTKKRLFFERAFELGKPFALLMTMAWLNDSGYFNVYTKFKSRLELLTFDKRIHYTDQEGMVNKKTTFASGYFCHNFLGNITEMRRINTDNQISLL